VFIVGGGPAGLVAAIAARQKGFNVTVADCSRPPFDKACGEGLMPDGIAALSRLGITIYPDEAYPFGGIRFIEGKRSAQAPFPHGFGLGIRRTALHRILVEHATKAGVSIHWGARVDMLGAGKVAVDGEAVRCRWIVGADGQNSRVRRWAGLDRCRRERVRYGCRQHFNVKPWTDSVEVYWGARCQLVITPIGPAEICVALLSGNPRMAVEEALDLFPEIQERLKDAPSTTVKKGAVSAMRSLRSVCRDPFLLVGDASGSVDAITGEGLCMAFQQAGWLADALETGNLAVYQAAHRRIARLPTLMSELLLLMDRHLRLRQGVLRAFAAQPEIFSKFVATHVGSVPVTSRREEEPTVDFGSPVPAVRS
jgi:flavin-dependent dehydrogenase